MSYNSILDTFFSSYWFSMAVPLALIPLYYALRSRIRKGKESTFGENFSGKRSYDLQIDDLNICTDVEPQIINPKS